MIYVINFLECLESPRLCTTFYAYNTGGSAVQIQTLQKRIKHLVNVIMYKRLK